MRTVAGLALVLSLAGLASVSQSDYLSAKRKFQALDKQPPKPGTRVTLTSAEINAYVQTELPKVGPPGVRNPSVELLNGNTATGRALIDFLKLRSAQGKSTNWLMRKLLEGEREVAVTTQIRSGGGQATVDLQRVEISGIAIEGATLDFIIDNYLKPNYPDAKIGQPFALHKHVDRIEVARGVAYIITR
jgi:hypothetical protein